GRAPLTALCFAGPTRRVAGRSTRRRGGPSEWREGRSLAASGECVWVGMEDGRICVLRRADGALLRSIRGAHAGPVLALAAVGAQMWSGSGDKTIVAHDARIPTTTTSSTTSSTPQPLFSLGEQGGYVKGLLLPFSTAPGANSGSGGNSSSRNSSGGGWWVWAFTSTGTRVLTAEALWRSQVERAEGAEGRLAAAKEEAAEAGRREEAAREEARRQQQAAEAGMQELRDQLGSLQEQLDAASQQLEVARKEATEASRQAEEAAAALAAEQEARARQGEAAAGELEEARARVAFLEGRAAALSGQLAEAAAAQEGLRGDKEAEALAAASAAEALRGAQQQLQGELAEARKELESERAAHAAALAEWVSREGE
ncbi:hypothetical protein Agub_g10317, partial [Astrephomene gubernaculifera]